MNNAQMLAMLRHAYEQLRTPGAVDDQSRFADGLIAPVIRALERKEPKGFGQIAGSMAVVEKWPSIPCPDCGSTDDFPGGAGCPTCQPK